MIWAFAVAAAAILYLALRFRRFQSWVEPVLTIVVAIGLASALLIWFVDERAPSGTPVTPNATTPVLSEETVVLAEMQASAGQTKTSFRVTGSIANKGPVPTQSFRLDVVLSDCPGGTCREVGRDSALIVLRVQPGESAAFSTFAVFPGIDLNPVTAPEWDFGVRDVRAVTR
ncbi:MULTISPECIES: hypothetical protein [unclassified Shinella]|jgi:hypothetical protein|uniref:hypothetical protein n=1 Tax=unclassified Shinella TaxID=2643062 RepID=UPI00234F7E5F|nr:MULTISPECIES: hypothetical protein [unclassified Shinella]MDC7262762.1 hypothetical protein [Shinella sp. HY16]MDC7269657.1 hypothetical protein [Shinella sp. YZ44]